MRAQISFEMLTSMLLSMLIALSIASMTAASIHGWSQPIDGIYRNANLTIAKMENLCGCSMVK